MRGHPDDLTLIVEEFASRLDLDYATDVLVAHLNRALMKSDCYVISGSDPSIKWLSNPFWLGLDNPEIPRGRSYT